MKTQNLYSTFSLTLTLLLSGVVHAGEGALALTTEPKEADIYVDGQLKANTTPIIFKLPEGKHQIEIKTSGKRNQQLEVLITNDAVISKKVTLVDLPPTSPPPAPLDIPSLLTPARDSFETEAEFQQRRRQLLQAFNSAVDKHDPRYQAGLATLDKAAYNINTGEFPLLIQWQPWAKALGLSESNYLKVGRDEATALWKEGEQKPVFLSMKSVANQTKVKQPVLVGVGRAWTLARALLPTQQYATFPLDTGYEGRVVFSPDGKFLVSGDGGLVKIWKVSTGQEVQRIDNTAKVKSLAFFPDGQWLVVGGGNTLKFWKVSTGEQPYAGLSAEVNSVAISPDGMTLAVGEGNGEIRLLQKVFNNMESFTTIKNLTGHDKSIQEVTFSPDGTQLASASQGNSVKVWEVQSGQLLHDLRGHYQGRWYWHGDSGHVHSVAFSPDGKLLASGSSDLTIKLWEVSTGKELRTLRGHTDTVYSVAFHPDGKVLASASKDKTIKLWEVSTGQELQTLTGPEDAITSVTFSPDGQLLVSGSWDKTIRWWGP
jgi:WD40 repeat protein